MSVLQTIKDSAKDLTSSDPTKRARAEEIKRRYQAGMFNAELTKEGAKPVPVAPPKVDLAAAMSSVKQEPGLQSKVPDSSMNPFTGPLPSVAGAKETLGDVKDTALGVGDQILKGGSDIADIAHNQELNPLQKGVGILGRLAGTVAGVSSEVTTGVGKLALTQDAENKLKEIAGNVGQAVSESDVAKTISNWYDGLNPAEKNNVDAAGGMLALASEVFGLKGANVVKKGVTKVADTVLETATPVVKKVAGEAVATAEKIPSAVQKVVAKSPEAADQALSESVKRVIQTPANDTATQARHVAAAKDTLTRIANTGTKDLTDYNTLKTKIETSIKGIKDAKAAYLSKFTQTYKPENLAIGETVNGVTQGWSPVTQALDGLEKAYDLSGDVANTLKIKQLKSKLETEGLTVSEIDDIAAKYGTEYKQKAFDKMGNVKPGYNADNFETIRRGVKQVARNKLPDDFAKSLDTQLSHDITTQKLIDRMAAVVQKRVDKLPKTSKLRNAVNSATNAVVGTADLLTGKVMSNIVKAVATRAGVLQKASLSPIELQDELRKQMRIIEKMNKIKDPKAYEKAVSKYLNEDSSFKEGVVPETTNSQKATNGKLQQRAVTKQFDYNAIKTAVDKRIAESGPDKVYTDNAAKSIADSIPNAHFIEAPLKGADRTLEKVINETKIGDVSNIKDIARNTIMPTTKEAHAQVVAKMDARTDIYARKPQEGKDFMGYKGMIYNIKSPSGNITETQVVSPEMMFGKMLPEDSARILGADKVAEIQKRTGLKPGYGHEIYEKYRKMTRKEKASPAGLKLAKESEDYYAQLSSF